MGNEARAKAGRKALFLAEHPICCYCGTNAATEVDHCPARVFFTGRVAPKDYEFPSCSICNRGVRNIEQVVALFAAMRLQGSSKDAALNKLFKHATNNMPGRKDELKETFRRKPFYIMPNGLLAPGAVSGDTIVMTRTGNIVSGCMDMMGHKLSHALYYKHVAKPLAGPVFCRTTPTVAAGDMLDAASASMLSAGPITRNNLDLTDQFSYEYTLNADNGFFAAAIKMGDQLAYLTFAIPSSMWAGFKRDQPVRAAELEKFGRPDILATGPILWQSS
jgi:hypothetical protein